MRPYGRIPSLWEEAWHESQAQAEGQKPGKEGAHAADKGLPSYVVRGDLPEMRHETL